MKRKEIMEKIFEKNCLFLRKLIKLIIIQLGVEGTDRKFNQFKINIKKFSMSSSGSVKI